MSDSGILQLPSRHSVHETVDRLQSLLLQKGIKIFARIDQRQEAASAGLLLQPTELIIFGNPKAGTQLMQQSLTAALDLPLKIAAVEDQSGQVWVLFNSPEYLFERHGLPEESLKVFSVVPQLADAART